MAGEMDIDTFLRQLYSTHSRSVMNKELAERLIRVHDAYIKVKKELRDVYGVSPLLSKDQAEILVRAKTNAEWFLRGFAQGMQESVRTPNLPDRPNQGQQTS
jgi:hypothetical protein